MVFVRERLDVALFLLELPDGEELTVLGGLGLEVV